MDRLVITEILEPFNSTRGMNGIASAIIGIFMQEHPHFAMICVDESSTGNNLETMKLMDAYTSDLDSPMSSLQDMHW